MINFFSKISFKIYKAPKKLKMMILMKICLNQMTKSVLFNSLSRIFYKKMKKIIIKNK